MPKVSIIVPVYNVENYLRKCLDSLVNQSYTNTEIIIIDDGSTDNSLKIIKEYEKKYPQLIKVVTKKNEGISKTRNLGLKLAKGDYLTFIDSDDYVSKDFIAKMLAVIIKDDSEIAICDIVDEGKNKNNYYNYIPFKACSIYEDKKQLFNRVAIWNKLIKKDLFKDLEFFPSRLGEDLNITIKLFLKAKKISYVNECLYHYVIRSSSIMNSLNREKNLDIINVFLDLINYVKKIKKEKDVEEEIELLAIEHLYIASIYRIISNTSYKSIKKDIEPYVSFMDKHFPDFQNNKYLDTLSKNQLLAFKLINHKHYYIIKILSQIKNNVNF